MKSKNYEEFVEKFKPKLTTDDCYTPEPVFKAVLDWARNRYKLFGRAIVRPFQPGGDYENYIYPPGCVVIDNPPFSIYSKIVRFYMEKDIDFLLFGPTLTLLVSGVQDVCYLVTSTQVIYENGAKVNTSFVTNLEKNKVVWTAPELARAVVESVERYKAEQPKKKVHKITLPENVITSARLGVIAKRYIDFSVDRDNCRHIRKVGNYQLFGCGLVLSPKATAEKAAAEKVAAEERHIAEFPPGEGWVEKE